MVQFRKKPIVVEAVRWDGSSEMAKKLVKWINDQGGSANFFDVKDMTFSISISTLEGEMYAHPGDWIIQGVENEFYPCKPSVFAKTFERND